MLSGQKSNNLFQYCERNWPPWAHGKRKWWPHWRPFIRIRKADVDPIQSLPDTPSSVPNVHKKGPFTESSMVEPGCQPCNMLRSDQIFMIPSEETPAGSTGGTRRHISTSMVGFWHKDVFLRTGGDTGPFHTHSEISPSQPVIYGHG